MVLFETPDPDELENDYFSKHFGKEFVNSSSNNGKKWVIIDPKSPQYQILKKICKSYKN